MPGVTETIRQTQLKQEEKKRQREMDELKKMVAEGRLHEATEHQLATLRLVTELQKSFEASAPSTSLPQDLAEVVKNAVTDAVANLPVGAAGGISSRPQDDPARPTMKHVSLDLSQDGEDLQISHGEGLGKEKRSSDDGEDKLKKLREIKGKK